MRSFDIEARTREILDRVVRGQPIEDSLVECKRDWPEPDVARQLAGHANAARGEPILWLLGVDLKAHTVVGVPPIEVATWYPQIAGNFDGPPPRVRDVNVSYGSTTVVALWFETDNGAPFVARKDKNDSRFDIPWREGTRTRSARRHEIFQLLAPAAAAPEVEILLAEALIGTSNAFMNVHLWVTPRSRDLVSFRLHECRIAFAAVHPGATRLSPAEVHCEAEWAPKSATIEHSLYQVICRGPGRVLLTCEFPAPAVEHTVDPNRPLDIELTLSFDGVEKPVSTSAVLKPWPGSRPGHVVGEWRIDPHNLIHIQ